MVTSLQEVPITVPRPVWLDELNSALDEHTETMASFDSARDPDDLIS